jgi:hypothetical protein
MKIFFSGYEFINTASKLLYGLFILNASQNKESTVTVHLLIRAFVDEPTLEGFISLVNYIHSEGKGHADLMSELVGSEAVKLINQLKQNSE